MSNVRRSAFAAVLACGLLVPGAPALAAGETTTTTLKITPAKAKIPKDKAKAKKGVQVKLFYKLIIEGAGGQRAANLSKGELPLPAGAWATGEGFETCALAKLQANDTSTCTAKSVAGSALGQINTQPLSETPFDADGVLYYTGLKSGLPTFAIYYTIRQFPTAHGISKIRFKKAKKGWTFSYDLHKLPTAPGLPDATALNLAISFDKKGPKGTAIRLSEPCKAKSVASKISFWDGSTATDTLKASC